MEEGGRAFQKPAVEQKLWGGNVFTVGDVSSRGVGWWGGAVRRY